MGAATQQGNRALTIYLVRTVCEYKCQNTIITSEYGTTLLLKKNKITKNQVVAPTPLATPNCALPDGYKPARSGARKAYKMMSDEMKYEEAKRTCEAENATMVMPKSVDDLNDIKGYFYDKSCNREYKVLCEYICPGT